MKYKEYTLDPFQEESIKHLENNDSVVVSAATGTGKTLIADYIINKANKAGKHVIFTAPIKALSNQKFKQFKAEYGDDRVGLLTGDIVINPDALILVMTTEIYRNMLLSNDKAIQNLSYVIFDEIHYINDIERGTVWEESIIFSPPHVRFLCLSATIPNAKEFASWIESIKHPGDSNHKVKVVDYMKRAVPLHHFVYDVFDGITTIDKIMKSKLPDYYQFTRTKRKKNQRKVNIPMPSHIDLLKDLKSNKFLPCIFFVFSRRVVEMKAKEIVRKFDFTSSEEKNEIISYMNKKIPREFSTLDSVRLIKQILPNGIAIHHAGLLPVVKEVVEHLFATGMIKVLYATETFAVGINMPAKTVCFNTLDKYDGINFRYLNSKEYFQMAGRAGRRGIDKIGRSIALIDRKYGDMNKIQSITTKDVEPIQSQFKLSFNSVLNLINNHTEKEISKILKSNFAYYQMQLKGQKTNIVLSYKHKIKVLKKLDHINKKGQLTDKGIFATRIYTNELLTTEIFGTDMWKNFDEYELACLLATLTFERRRGNMFYKKTAKDKYAKFARLLNQNPYLKQKLKIELLRDIVPLVYHWTHEGKFKDMMKFTNFQEGDYIRFFRQIIDLLRQILKATTNEELKFRLHEIKDKIDRDVIEVKF
ncbi:MAG: DEAD/DEAH box helicase [archaeon]